MPTLHNKIKNSADFEQNKICPFFETFCQFWDSKSAEIKTLLYNVGIGNKLYEIFFFDLCVKKWSL